MTTTKWQRLRTLFDEVYELPPPERPAFLDANCNGDPDLRRELEQLLAAGSEDDNPLSRPLPDLDVSILPNLQEALAALPRVDGYEGLILKNRYHVQKHLGKGGFGSVHLALDGELDNRQVVVKFLPSAQTKASWHERRFRQELQALAKLDHPGIVSIYDTGETAAGVPYLVMQYIPGLTVGDLLKAGTIPFERLRKWVGQVAEALTAAHEKGISHRDLKPENIMIRHGGKEEEERAVLLDFGLAILAGEPGAERRTSTQIAGTPAYMAPEQLLGNAVEASDQYALGVVIFEALTGSQLHEVITADGPAAAVSAAIGHRTDVPPGARAALLRALAFSPRERFTSTREFAAAFCAVQAPIEEKRWGLLLAVALLVICGVALLRWMLPAETRIAFSMTDQGGGVPSPNTRFGRGDRIRLRFAPSTSGCFYLFNGAETAASMQLLFPGAGLDILAIPADQIVEFPTTPGEFLEFDGQKGDEHLWIVWSARPIPALEALRRFSQAPFGGEIRDPQSLRQLRTFLRSVPLSEPSPIAGGSGSVFGTRRDVLVGKVVLQHE